MVEDRLALCIYFIKNQHDGVCRILPHAFIEKDFHGSFSLEKGTLLDLKLPCLMYLLAKEYSSGFRRS